MTDEIPNVWEWRYRNGLSLGAFTGENTSINADRAEKKKKKKKKDVYSKYHTKNVTN